MGSTTGTIADNISMNLAIELGLLDLCTVHAGMKPDDVLWQTLEMVPRVEEMGYSRYWLAEHHTSEVAHSSPTILVPVLAGISQRMRIGVAGILLECHSPFRVAGDFRLLSTIFPGRIDLGIARAPVHPIIQQLLLSGPEGPSFPQRVNALMRFLRGTGETSTNPVGIAPPEVWLLGRRETSMRIAAEIGSAFCLSLFLGEAQEDSERYLEEYRRDFKASPELAEPRCSVAFAGVCAESESEAKRIAANYGTLAAQVVAGTPEMIASTIAHMIEKYKTREFVFLDLCQELSDRIRSCELVAEALNLKTAGPPAGAEPLSEP